jgi:hypothetical protein
MTDIKVHALWSRTYTRNQTSSFRLTGVTGVATMQPGGKGAKYAHSCWNSRTL